MKRVDVTGEVCPRPALIVRRELAELEAGETLVVEGDYPPAERNLRRSCASHGFEVSDADDRIGGGDGADGDGGDDATFGLAITVTEDASLAEE